MAGASNIILTQGRYDPWSGGGFKADSPSVSQDRGIYVMEIDGSAHHLDLRTPNTCDPNTVANARFQIVGILDCWIQGCNSLPKLTNLPSLSVSNGVKCADVNLGYPWGQTATGSSSTTVAGFCYACFLLRKVFSF
ncbi:hypothetical protein COOONC_05637 [Cooperia oncophora]